jgi:hypothetical protein
MLLMVGPKIENMSHKKPFLAPVYTAQTTSHFFME